jgi:hypothetical protein
MEERPMRREMIVSVCGALLLAFGAAGCEKYMIVEGRVTDCATGAPIVGVRATLTLDEGVSDSERSVAFTGPDGIFEASLNEPPSVSATLLLEKPGYNSVTRPFAEAPESRQDFCLAQP